MQVRYPGRLIKPLLLRCLAILLLSFWSAQQSYAQLNNGAFEGAFTAVATSKPSRITGDVAPGWIDNSAWADVNVDYARETVNPHGGTSCQKVTLQSVRSGEFQFSQDFSAKAGRLYTAGVWLRGTPGARVNVTLFPSQPPFKGLSDNPVFLNADWTFYALGSHVTKSEKLTLMINGNEPLTLCIDDASLADVAGAVVPQITSRISWPAFGMHIDNYLASKGPTNLNVEGAFRPVNSPRATITGMLGTAWQDNSDWADVVLDYSANTSTPHNGAKAQRLVLTTVTSGFAQTYQVAYLRTGQSYKASIWIRGTAGMKVGLALRKWEAPYTDYAAKDVIATGNWQKVNISGKVTGSGVSTLMVRAYTPGTLDFDDAQLVDSTGKVPILALPWPTARVGAWRFWDQTGTTWATLEPQKGVWTFASMDKAVSDAKSHNAQIVLTLGQSPTWASARPTESSNYGAGAAAEPADINDWKNYLRKVATRYRGKIFYYEIWNEPNDSAFYSGSIPKLVELTQTARETLKAVDPRIQIVSASPYSVGYLKQYLAAGAKGLVDIVGYHIYNAPPEDDARVLADLRLVLKQTGIAAKPLWITEGATGDTRTPAAQAAGLLARKYLVEYLYGAKRFFWYSWGVGHSLGLPVTNPDGVTPAKSGVALANLEKWLVGSTLVSTRVDAAGTWVVRVTTVAGKPGYILWNPKGARQWTVPSGFKPGVTRDLAGGSVNAVGAVKMAVTAEPVFVVGR